MSAPPFMQLYVADYLGDTQHLTTEQHGAYMLILMAMWRAGGTLPNDEKKIARIVGLTPAKWRRVGADVMAFFTEQDGEITQKRLAKEIEKAQEKSAKRASAGAKGGAAKALKTKETDLANATVLPQHSSESDIRDQKEEEKDYAFRGSVIRLTRRDFDRWQESYPNIPSMRAELQRLDDYYAGLPADERRGWFHRASSNLAKADREATERRNREAAIAAAAKRAGPQSRYAV